MMQVITHESYPMIKILESTKAKKFFENAGIMIIECLSGENRLVLQNINTSEILDVWAENDANIPTLLIDETSTTIGENNESY